MASESWTTLGVRAARCRVGLCVLTGLMAILVSLSPFDACAQDQPGNTSVEPPWAEILGPAKGFLAAPRPKLVWLADLDSAFRQAREESRPLFVTFRCLPCKQCADFDKDVLEGGRALDPVLRRFITVRLTSMRDVDLRLFPVEGFQDLDLSWWGWFFSPDGRLYGVYGGRDEVSDTTRISVSSLANTLWRVLAHHYDPRRKQWNIDGPAVDPRRRPITPVKLPGWPSWAKRGAIEVASDQCLHCHQVAEILRQPAIDAGTFDKGRDFDIWPFPENVGMVLDRDHGLRVMSIEAGSPADVAGLRPGDVLGAADGRRLFGQADFRAALHRGPRGDGSIRVHWLRGSSVPDSGDGQVLSGRLEMADRWRRTILDWRSSVAGAAVGAHPGIPWVHEISDQDRKRLNIPAGTMAVRPWFGKQPGGAAYDAGLRGRHVITDVNNQNPNKAERAFRVWFRLHFEPGQEVTLNLVDRDGQPSSIRYVLP